tara:strand:+ start:2179 stop:2472 length:294 start_codon:yes stop_codon:yes gene_type:complete
MACGNKERITCETTKKVFSEAPWPPTVQFEENEDPVVLTEFDVSWVFCSVLGMKWNDAQQLTDITERKFLYNKALHLTEQAVQTRMAQEAKDNEVNL